MTQELWGLRERWAGIGRNQRLAIFGIILTAAVIVGLLVVTRPPQQYQTAFSGLSTEDAAAIVDQLQSSGIPYQLSADGTTVRVPPSKVAEVRLSAASQGLPKGGNGVGFELFDKSSFGITDFAQRVNYQRAIEGELERTIDTIDAVASSRVHIVVPEESLFTDEQQPTTAAVVLQLKGGQRLSSPQIKGITHLVSGSVPGLQPENLTVIDSAGNPIWSGGEESTVAGGAVGDDQFAQQRAYEHNMEQQLEALVGQVVGANHAAVQVSATLNWDQRTVDSETYSPDGADPQILSQQESTSRTTSGAANGSQGVPGVDSNVPTYQAPDAAATATATAPADATPGTTAPVAQTGDVSDTHDVTTNYELSKRTEHLVQAPGQLQRLSVAVVLDGTTVDPAVAKQIESIISTAAGIVPQRGDAVTVSAVPFSELDPADQLPAPAGTPILTRGLDIGEKLGLVIVPIVALLIARKALQRERPATTALATQATMSAPYAAHAYQQTMAPGGQATMREVFAPRQSMQPANTVQAFEQIRGLATSDPTQVAQLLRVWMKEEQ